MESSCRQQPEQALLSTGGKNKKTSFQGLTNPLIHAIIIHVVKRHGAMAQSVEHIVHIDGVVGSSPTGTTQPAYKGWFFVAQIRTEHIVHIDGAFSPAPPVAEAAGENVN